jgi:hypothetical protein
MGEKERADHNIEVSAEMVEAGVKALYEAIGYQFNGDPRETVEHVFRQMALARER